MDLQEQTERYAMFCVETLPNTMAKVTVAVEAKITGKMPESVGLSLDE